MNKDLCSFSTLISHPSILICEFDSTCIGQNENSSSLKKKGGAHKITTPKTTVFLLYIQLYILYIHTY